MTHELETVGPFLFIFSSVPPLLYINMLSFVKTQNEGFLYLFIYFKLLTNADCDKFST